jgi:uncharacterized protein
VPPAKALPTSLLESLQVVLKVSESCNLKCSYCYFFFAGDESWKSHPVSIALDTVGHVGAYLRQLATAHHLKQIEVILHGGEPLLMRNDRFRKLLQTFRQHETPDFCFVFSIQTNAVLIDDEWVDIFAEFNVSVGVSLDGNREVNDLHRIDAQGHSSYDDTITGLRKVQEAARQGRLREPGIICVVNPQADGAKTYRHFVDDLQVKSLSLRIPIYTHDRAPVPEAIININRFMQDALGEWLKDDDASVSVREFVRPLNAMVRDDVADFTAEFSEDYRNIVSISSNGDVGPEDGVRTVHPRFANIGLNVRDSSFEQLIATNAWHEMHAAATTAPEACKQCVWWRMCKGGPLVTRFSDMNGFNNPSIYCEGLKEMYSMIADALAHTGISREEVFSRLQAKPLNEKAL